MSWARPVRNAGFHRLRRSRSWAGDHGHDCGALSGVAGGSVSTGRSAAKGIGMKGFFLLARIGWRNLWRSPGGTLLAALASGLGLTLLLISLGLLDGSHEQMVGNRVRYGAGHVVIQARGYQASGSQDLLMTAKAVAVAERVLARGRHETSRTRRKSSSVASGLLTSAANPMSVRIIGVDPGRRTRSVVDSHADRRGEISQDDRQSRASSSVRRWPAGWT